MPEYCNRTGNFCEFDPECEDCLHCPKYREKQREAAEEYMEREMLDYGGF